ncbi:MAG: tRNA (N(6)-L-threonylcarbamoyladenosine(37)-C(2))-methylthiotransferase MtaB [Mogibacterium sp.]|nr:tRNA (N(6)-L-threonylcarbamoyladenosine(37)-C(2))-methylthiotransferase MtaB [Mogibacterium sp.]
MKVAFHTLGCKVNHYETEAIKEAFVSRGAEIVGEEDPADVYVINTCTVTNIADRKSRQFIRRAKKTNPDAVIVVTGCYAQVAAEDVAAMPEVDLVMGNNRKSEICGLVMEKFVAKSSTEAPAEGLDADRGHAEVRVIPRDELTFYEDLGKIKSASGEMSRAYIKIQDGCDRFCSYCLIPYARGPVRSRKADEIVEEVRDLVEAGFREVVLTGINTALYGTEAGAEHSLSELLTMLDELETSENFRIRLSSLEPTVVDKDNVEEIIRHRRLCHHLHLSVQNGSDSVLKAMNRHYTREEYLDIVFMLRNHDPLFGITTDIIVGFPGETEKDFEDTLDIVKKSAFGRTHVFRYSPRKGTAGAAMKDAVPEQIKKERAEVLESLGEKAAKAFTGANLGVTHTVLIEESCDGYATGYTGNYIKTYIEDPEGRIEAGKLYKVVLTRTFRDGALAVLE